MQHKKYITHVKREVELSPPEISIMKKGPEQNFIEIWTIQGNITQ